MRLILAEGVLSFYSLSTLSPLTGPGFAPLRGVSTFALDEAQLSSPNPFTSIQLVIIKRKTLQLLNFTKEGVNPVRVSRSPERPPNKPALMLCGAVAGFATSRRGSHLGPSQESRLHRQQRDVRHH